ncbi:hypothetical protein LCGC14_2892360, partial [marine sediment metagenome]
AVRDAILLAVGQHDRNPDPMMWVRSAWGSLLLELWYDAKLREVYKAFVKRKKEQPCSLEQFVAIGHSSGGTGIYNVLKKGKTFQKAGRFAPAYFGMIDTIIAHGHDLTDKAGWTTVEHYHAPKTKTIKGIRNIPIPGVGHYSILKNQKMIQEMAKAAAQAYLKKVKEEINNNPSWDPWDTRPPPNGW